MSAAPAPSEAAAEARARWVVVALAVLVVTSVVALNGWVCDDAFISLRTAAQFWAGEGLVYNQGWRVQAYTHPAWMLLILLAHGLTGGGFWTLIGLGLLVTALGVGVAVRALPDARAVTIFVAGLISSRAFVEYASSGLENPATHLVLILAAVLALDRRMDALVKLRRVALLAALAFLCRPDAILLLAPLVVFTAREARAADVPWAKLAVALGPGLALFAAWELFSFIYYGALVPNTALAKLGVGIGRVELARRGLGYVLGSLSSDPVTTVLVIVGIALPALGEEGSTLVRMRPLALGSALYLVYVIAIGGDFMEGRFLTASAWLGVFTLASHRRVDFQERWAWALGLTLAFLSLAGLGARHPLVPDRGEAEPRAEGGIADERSFYAAEASVLVGLDGHPMPSHPWRLRAEAHDLERARVVHFNTMGYFGYFVGLEVHIVDGFALADPLLARIPPVRRLDWKAGHHARIMPTGYLEALEHESEPGEERGSTLADPALAALYEQLRLVHTAPLFAPGRFAAILDLRLGGRWREDFEPERYALAELEVVATPRTRAWLRRPKRFRDAGIELDFGQARTVETLSLELSLGQTYAFEWRSEGEVQSREIAELSGELEGLGVIELRPEQPEQRYDALRIVPLTMNGKRSLALRRVRLPTL